LRERTSMPIQAKLKTEEAPIRSTAWNPFDALPVHT
jgi:hypothetical protein